MKIVRVTTAGLLGLVLVACSNTTAGTATATSSAASSATSSSAPSSSSETSTSASSASTPATSAPDSGELDPVAAELITKVAAALSQVTSLSGDLTIDAGAAAGGTVAATFDETLADGVATALSMNMQVSGQTVDILYVDERLLVGGAFAQQYGGQWVELTADTTDPTLSQMYSQFQASVDNSGPSQYLEFLQLATNTEMVGTEQINGVETEKYTLDLDLTRLDTADVSDSTRESLGQVQSAGVDTVPCTFWVDENGLMQQVQQDIEVGTTAVHTTVTFSNYNEPMDITAPDPATVVTK